MSSDSWNTAEEVLACAATRGVHRGFVQKLADSVNGDCNWSEAVAGLLALRAVDQWLQPVAPGQDVQPDSLSAVEARIEQLGADSEVALPLTRVVDSLRSAQRGASTGAIRAVCNSLYDYGLALEDAADWSLALDVYATCREIAALLADPLRTRLEAGAEIRVGRISRIMGSLDEASRILARVSESTRRVHWREGELRAELSAVKVLIARGALPVAQQRLETVVSLAASERLPEVHALALHDLGMTLGMRGQLTEAIKRLFDAYRLTSAEDIGARWAVLCDIAYTFSLLGLHDVSRDVFRVIASHGSTQWGRWIAANNLMELAALVGDVAEFERWRDWLSRQQMSPEVRANYYLDVGRAKLAFGQVFEGIQMLEVALGIAEKFGYGRLIFTTEAALATARERQPRHASRRPIRERDRDAEAIAEIGELLRAELAIT